MNLDGLRVNHAGLDSAAQDLYTAVKEIDDRMNRLEGGLAPLKSDWTGNAQTSYHSAKAKWDTSMREMRDLLDQTSQTVNNSNADYKAADQRGAAAFDIGRITSPGQGRRPTAAGPFGGRDQVREGETNTMFFVVGALSGASGPRRPRGQDPGGPDALNEAQTDLPTASSTASQDPSERPSAARRPGTSSASTTARPTRSSPTPSTASPRTSRLPRRRPAGRAAGRRRRPVRADDLNRKREMAEGLQSVWQHSEGDAAYRHVPQRPRRATAPRE